VTQPREPRKENMMAGYLMPLTIAVLLQMPFLTLAFEIHGLNTTWRADAPSDVQPATLAELKASEFAHLDAHAGCGNGRFAGNRYVNNYGKDQSSFIIIFDAQGNAAGMQSLIPSSEFNWDCTENEFYTKETLQIQPELKPVEYCMTTMYFRDPSTICDKEHKASNKLHLQKGESFKPENLVTLPEMLPQVEEDPEHWVMDNYFPGMGHHITKNEKDSNDCQSFMPIQGLYALIDGQCHNTGFVWMHVNSKVEGHEWETPPQAGINFILSKPAQCQLDAANHSVLKTMHIYLGGSTAHC